MNFTWKNETRNVADLVPADYNPRRLTEKQRADLTKSLDEFGLVDPIIINLNNHIIGGHQRIKICADLKIKTVDVRIPNKELDARQERALNLRLNKNTGEWDWSILETFDIDLLEEVGFDKSELQALTGDFNYKNKEIESDDLKDDEAGHDAKKCPQCGYEL